MEWPKRREAKRRRVRPGRGTSAVEPSSAVRPDFTNRCLGATPVILLCAERVGHNTQHTRSENLHPMCVGAHIGESALRFPEPDQTTLSDCNVLLTLNPGDLSSCRQWAYIGQLRSALTLQSFNSSRCKICSRAICQPAVLPAPVCNFQLRACKDAASTFVNCFPSCSIPATERMSVVKSARHRSQGLSTTRLR